MTREEALRLATKLVCRQVDKIDKMIKSVVLKGGIPYDSLLEEKQKYEEAYSALVRQSIPVGVHTAALEYAREQYEFDSKANLPNICQSCYNSMIMDFKAGAEWMASQGTIIKGWVARDKDKQLCIFYGDKPHRGGCNRWWQPEHCPLGDWMNIPDENFPDITWEDEPVEVELTIRKK